MILHVDNRSSQSAIVQTTLRNFLATSALSYQTITYENTSTQDTPMSDNVTQLPLPPHQTIIHQDASTQDTPMWDNVTQLPSQQFPSKEENAMEIDLL
jgi:hypothetical protein